ncbi:CMRF35-like molecule 1 [Sceloporus undulatus]|uniref:CMRF35-like molecule 1 n=1 Tax=Sceloporus undulatus TaxID=8520 RepID=UPI001C4DCD03|nr:CMRF35-like molecule 1 [Sceloporus undulatus]
MDRLLLWHLTAGPLFLLVGFTSALEGPKELAGFLGRPLSVVCRYTKGYEDYAKYWCQGDSWRSCKTVVKTGGTEAEAKAGRTFIKDNRTSLHFTVTLEKLTEEDAGTYWCAIERTGSDPGFLVTITVLPAPTTIAVTTTSVPTEPIFPIKTTESSPGSGLHDNLTILLPTVFLILVAILTGALLLMWRLKKQKAAKTCKDIPLPMSPRPTEGNTSETVLNPRFRHHHKAAPSNINQVMNNHPAEVEYTAVAIGVPTAAASSQVHTNAENISYATLRFSMPDEQATYANV